MRLAMPVRVLAQRFAYALLVALALALLVVARTENAVIERFRSVVLEVAAPVLSLISAPVQTVNRFADVIHDHLYVYEENARLRQDNARLLHWQEVARRLEQENVRLRGLAAAGNEIQQNFISARVIGDSGGAFVRTLLLGAGESSGIKRGYSVIAENGLVGRVVETAQRASRVLLITDLNSRIPVMFENSRRRAILAGDNSDVARIEYLPAGPLPASGERVVTSGDGGLFPPGLVVGTVIISDAGAVRVQPLVDFDRLEFVSVLQFDASRINTDDAQVRPTPRRR